MGITALSRGRRGTAVVVQVAHNPLLWGSGGHVRLTQAQGGEHWVLHRVVHSTSTEQAVTIQQTSVTETQA